jgi:hypothetical protein
MLAKEIGVDTRLNPLPGDRLEVSRLMRRDGAALRLIQDSLPERVLRTFLNGRREPEEFVRQLLRHSTLTMTLRYAKMAKIDVAALRAAFDEGR